jgi:hypothetical protein
MSVFAPCRSRRARRSRRSRPRPMPADSSRPASTSKSPLRRKGSFLRYVWFPPVVARFRQLITFGPCTSQDVATRSGFPIPVRMSFSPHTNTWFRNTPFFAVPLRARFAILKSSRGSASASATFFVPGWYFAPRRHDFDKRWRAPHGILFGVAHRYAASRGVGRHDRGGPAFCSRPCRCFFGRLDRRRSRFARFDGFAGGAFGAEICPFFRARGVFRTGIGRVHRIAEGIRVGVRRPAFDRVFLQEAPELRRVRESTAASFSDGGPVRAASSCAGRARSAGIAAPSIAVRGRSHGRLPQAYSNSFA